jgi:hypothetical protein
VTAPEREKQRAVEWLREVVDADPTKLALSALIIVSLLPFRWVSQLTLIFFVVFGAELALRLVLLREELRTRRINRAEVVLLLLDVIAIISFLPWETVIEVKFLRLFRLSRMVILISYWSSIGRDVWLIVAKRERRYQIIFIASVVLILSLVSAIILSHFRELGVDLALDYHEDGRVDPPNELDFSTLLWWSFRQLQDPGNLVKQPAASLAFVCSFFLTMSGIFVVTFLIGIGTSIVEELVEQGRQRRIGIRRHTVIANIGLHGRVLIEELVSYYTKSLRLPRVAVIGEGDRLDFLYTDKLRRVRYRKGQAISTHDLLRVDADRATRVILLSRNDLSHSDAEVASQVLSIREVNPGCWIFAELTRAENVHAVLRAGGRRTVPILARQCAALLLAEIVLFPGIELIYRELLTSRGDEIYTCLYGTGEMEGYGPPSAMLMPFAELLDRAQRTFGVVLLGYLVRDETSPTGFTTRFHTRAGAHDAIADDRGPPVDQLLGFLGLASSFANLRDLVRSLPDITAKPSAEPALTLPETELYAAGQDSNRILICGYNENIVDFCEQLIRFSDGAEIFIIVPDTTAAQATTTHLVARSEVGLASVGNTRVRFEQVDQRLVRYVKERAPGAPTARSSQGMPVWQVRGSIRLMVGDWSDERVLVDDPGQNYRLSEMEVVLLTPTETDDDPDARTALALLKLIGICERGTVTRPGLRLVCEVKRGEKAKLFEGRFARDEGKAGPSITIVSGETLRNSFLAQSVFVPGCDQIYSELLSDQGSEICRLVFRKPLPPDLAGATVSFGQLLTAVYRRDGLVAIAVDLFDESGSERRMVINPKPRSKDYQFQIERIHSLLAIGNSQAWTCRTAPRHS